MEQRNKFFKLLQQRKTVVALIIVSLLAAFLLVWWWAKGSDITASAELQKGFNVVLPDPVLKEDTQLDKMSYYEKAALDSARLVEEMKNDPYYDESNSINEMTINTDETFAFPQNKHSKGGLNTSPYSKSTHADANEEKIYAKLEKINTALSAGSSGTEIETRDRIASLNNKETSLSTVDEGKLEKLVNDMSQNEGDDRELQQMNGMLEKILDIQHPERLQDKLKQASKERKGKVFAIAVKGEPDPVYSIGGNDGNNNQDSNSKDLIKDSNGFNQIENWSNSEDLQSAIEAVIHETQTLVDGSIVKLRLTNDIFLNGSLIPKNNFLFGTALLDGERLDITIRSIRFKNSLFPVELSVYDMDGMEGIYIPGTIARDIAKQTPDMALQNIGLTSLNPSVGVQAASAGIEAAKSFVSKKSKLTKVTVKAGYKVLLNDEKQKLDE